MSLDLNGWADKHRLLTTRIAEMTGYSVANVSRHRAGITWPSGAFVAAIYAASNGEVTVWNIPLYLAARRREPRAVRAKQVDPNVTQSPPTAINPPAAEPAAAPRTRRRSRRDSKG